MPLKNRSQYIPIVELIFDVDFYGRYNVQLSSIRDEHALG